MALITKITVRRDFRKSHLPTVLIVDDSDLPKTGMRMEQIGKEQGMTAKQLSRRYCRERDSGSYISKCKEEYFKSKGEKLIDMVKRAIGQIKYSLF